MLEDEICASRQVAQKGGRFLQGPAWGGVRWVKLSASYAAASWICLATRIGLISVGSPLGKLGVLSFLTNTTWAATLIDDTFLFFSFFCRGEVDMPAPKHRRQMTTWQVFSPGQVKREISRPWINPRTSSLRFAFLLHHHPNSLGLSRVWINDRRVPKHRRQVTTWQVFFFCQVEKETSRPWIDPRTSSLRFGCLLHHRPVV